MKQQSINIVGMLVMALLLMNTVIFEVALTHDERWYQALWLNLPLLAVVALVDVTKHSACGSGLRRKQ